jgi:hypothetical protein
LPGGHDDPLRVSKRGADFNLKRLAAWWMLIVAVLATVDGLDLAST